MKKRFSFKNFLIASLLKDAKGTTLWCNHCGAPFIKFDNLNRKQYNDTTKVGYDIECLKCGAKGRVIETWYEPKK